MSSRIAIHNTVGGVRLPRGKLTRLADLVLHGRRRNRTVNLVFIGDARMRRINREYRNQDKTTDVLSFNLEDETDPLLGEIYVSVPQARRNAKHFGVGIQREILKLCCHGLLHLCEIHHPDDQSRRKMAALELKYLRRLDNREAV